jgi:transcriptional regulator with XRE-family HTH domain
MTNLERIERNLTPARRKRIAARARQLVAEEMSLRELRTAQQRTQESIADALGIGQDSVSRLEQRSDLLISTLRGYVEAVGGQLSLIAQFPDRDPVSVSSLTALRTTPLKPRQRQRASTKHRSSTAKSFTKREKTHSGSA